MVKQILAVLLLCSVLCSSVYAQNQNLDESVLTQNQQMETSWIDLQKAASPGNPGEAVKELANTLYQNCETDTAYVCNVYEWVCSNLSYDMDAWRNGVYTALSAESVLLVRKSMCEGFSNLICALLREQGIACVKVWGTLIGENESWTETRLQNQHINHTWVEVLLNARWETLDCTLDIHNQVSEGVWTSGTPSQYYLFPTQKILSERHLIIEREFMENEDIPSASLQPMLLMGWCEQVLPVTAFSDYQRSITLWLQGVPVLGDVPVHITKEVILFAIIYLKVKGVR